MNNILKRILVGVCIALVMMLVHKVSHAAIDFNGYGSTPTAFCTGFWKNSSYNGTVVWKATPGVYGTCWSGTQQLNQVPPPTGVCDAGFHLDSTTQSCVANPPDCSSGVPTKFLFDTGPLGANNKMPTNDGYCGLSLLKSDGTKAGFSSCYNSSSDPKTAHVMCYWVGARDGTTAPGGSAPPPVDPTPAVPKPSVPVNVQGDPGQGCPAGTSNIGTDSTGTPMCRGSGTAPNTDNTTTTNPGTVTNNADGTKTQVSTAVNNNPDGSQTTTTNTCVTATTGSVNCHTFTSTGTTPTGAQGTPGKTSAAAPGTAGAGGTCASGQNCNDMCALHPDLNVCANSQVSGSNCNGPVDMTACTGDAIACSILRQQRSEVCANSVQTPAKTLYEQMSSGSDPLSSTLPSKANAQVVNGTNSIDQSGFLGGGSCYADYQFQYHGTSLAIPFSNVCPYLIPLRVAIMLSALVAAYYMLSGAILRT